MKEWTMWLVRGMLKVLLALLGKGWLWSRKPAQEFKPDESGILPYNFGATWGWKQEYRGGELWIWTSGAGWQRPQILQDRATGKRFAYVIFSADSDLAIYIDP